jgi:hypothetical protein
MEGGVSFKIKITPPARPVPALNGPSQFIRRGRRHNDSKLIPKPEAA